MAAVASNEALRSHRNRNGAMGPDDLFLDAQLRALRHVAVFRAICTDAAYCAAAARSHLRRARGFFFEILSVCHCVLVISTVSGYRSCPTLSFTKD